MLRNLLTTFRGDSEGVGTLAGCGVEQGVLRSPRGRDGVRGALARSNIGTMVDIAMGNFADTIPPGSVATRSGP
ncbi:MAG: hypothetical protein F4Y03_08045 [Alphaproteobacteria bacterium]|nr:hypothetical protein [Alphaproteobacteria bacterium]